jgi:hypothetical protein
LWTWLESGGHIWVEYMPKGFIYAGFGLTLGLYSVYSLTQVDVNLVLSDREWFWQAQQMMWQLGQEARGVSAGLFSFLVLSSFFFYRHIIHGFRQGGWNGRDFRRLIVISVLALLPAYPALSHDVFNYAMNAKMVWKYGADPHRAVALDFPDDPWPIFMRNTHTPAPYAKGWTYLSIPWGFIGQESIKANILSFKLLNLIAYLSLLWIISKTPLTKPKGGLAILAFNPLVLIETFGNVHNDVVMMALSIAGLGIGLVGFRQRRFAKVIVGTGIWMLSVWIKYASLMLLVGIGLYLLSKRFKTKVSFGGMQALAHGALLLSERSKWFLPWYLLWPFTFVPFIKEARLVRLLIVFSIAALLAYVPYLFWGEYHPIQEWQRRLILWGLPGLWLLGNYLIKPKAAA